MRGKASIHGGLRIAMRRTVREAQLVMPDWWADSDSFPESQSGEGEGNTLA